MSHTGDKLTNSWYLEAEPHPNTLCMEGNPSVSTLTLGILASHRGRVGAFPQLSLMTPRAWPPELLCFLQCQSRSLAVCRCLIGDPEMLPFLLRSVGLS